MLYDTNFQNTAHSAPPNKAELGDANEKWTKKRASDRVPEESRKSKQKTWSLYITHKNRNGLLEGD